MKTTDFKKYLELVKEFDTAMLVTRRGGKLRSRPMVVADVSEDGKIWFLTSVDSGKIEELTEQPSVNVAMQDGSRFLSVSGASVVGRDPDKLDELWSIGFGIWFPDGKDDPSLAILHVVPDYVEYWDSSGKEGIKALVEIGRSAVTGEKPSFDDDVHEKVEFPDRASSPD